VPQFIASFQGWDIIMSLLSNWWSILDHSLAKTSRQSVLWTELPGKVASGYDNYIWQVLVTTMLTNTSRRRTRAQ
jgi:hypothetical protein